MYVCIRVYVSVCVYINISFFRLFFIIGYYQILRSVTCYTPLLYIL